MLITGPRQVGKTTVAKTWLAPRDGRYLNWDVPADREALLKGRILEPTEPKALLLDEIHKYPRWRNWLKGLYDRAGSFIPTVVTGSARLDIYRRGGDSMFGRFEQLRLHPFSIAELTSRPPSPPPADWQFPGTAKPDATVWDRLLRRGGFPEPYTRDDSAQYRRWQTQRRVLLIREDLRDLTQIREVAMVEHLMLLLPGRVGSPLSINALREELAVGHDTVSNWIEALERLYLCYRILPYSKRLNRALKKERKLYLWDWSVVEEPGAKFENMVAGHLLKAVHYWTDLGFGEYDLQYLRDKEKREVDFVITESRRPVALIEAKLSDTSPSESLRYYRETLGEAPAVQLVATPGIDQTRGGTRVVTAADYLASLV